MMTFASVIELESFADGTFHLARAELALELASASCEAVARQVGASIELVEDDQVELDGTGTSVLTLPRWPVVSVETVDLDGTSVEFRWSRNGILERETGVWTVGRRNVTVTFTHGFETVPEPIKAVTLQAASRAVLNPARLNSFSDGQVSVGFGGGGVGTQVLGLLPDERNMVLWALRR